MFCPKWGKWSFSRIILVMPKVRDYFTFKRKTLYYTLDWGNRSFLGLKSTFLNFSENLVIRFLGKYASLMVLKSGQNLLAF